MERRQPLLGQLVNDKQAPRVEWTSLGSTIAQTIERLPMHYQGLKIIAKCIMPDHIHLVLHLYEDHGYSIKEISRGLRQACRKDYMKAIGVNINRQILSTEPYKHYTQSEAPEKGTQMLLFETPFFRTLAHKGQLDMMIQYIHDNPHRAMLKQQNPDLFILRRDTRVGELRFTSLGNLFLLDYPDKQPVICSRSLNEQQIAAQQTAILRQAENGCVTVTAAISPGERMIARAVREAEAPLIILRVGSCC